MNRYLILLSLAFSSIASAFSLSQYKASSALGQSSEQWHRKPLSQPSRKQRMPQLLSVISSLEHETPHHTTSMQTSQPVLAPHRLNVQQFVYVVLTSIFVTCLIIADVIGVKIFELKLPFPIFGHKTIEHTCGMITFPITFLLGDVINEYYGAKAAKDTIYIGLAMSILVFGVMNFAQALPYLQKPFNVTPQAFDMIFGSAKLMYIASICAYLIGQLSDVWLFGVIKRVTKGNYLWLRATGSTLISQMLDSFVVSYMAFSFGKSVTNQIPATMREVMNIAITGYGLKFVISLLITPILYLVRNLLHDKFGFRPLPADYVEE
jgi:uncharacterized integral membrane protein (TIGR00697 family)